MANKLFSSLAGTGVDKLTRLVSSLAGTGVDRGGQTNQACL